MTLVSHNAPILYDDDSVFPGEGWFFYWKTSSSLWESKIKEKGGQKVFIPINWAFHSDTGDDYDFALQRPETNLKKLASICNSLGKEAHFLLPLGPLPFLPNGGIPHFLARTMSRNELGLNLSVIDREGQLNKIFTFFDTRVFRSYSKFVHNLALYFSREGIPSPLWGIRSYYQQEDKLNSLFHDSSSVFEQAFSGFLQVKREELIQLRPNQGAGPLITEPGTERDFKREFTGTVEDIYLKEASQKLAPNWEGVMPVCFIGAGMNDFFYRLADSDSKKSYMETALRLCTLGVVPSTILLSQSLKQGAFGVALKDIIEDGPINKYFDPEFYSGEHEHRYKSVVYFDIYAKSSDPKWSENLKPLLNVFDESYHWCYQLHLEKDFFWDEDSEIRKVVFYERPIENVKTFHLLLKYLMSGGSIVLNKQQFSPDLKRKFETFVMENSLKVEKVNYKVEIERVSLGEGSIVLYNYPPEHNISDDEKVDIWKQLVALFEIKHLSIQKEDGIFCYWQSRSATNLELNFEEIRKVNFYNPTSYKRVTKIRSSKHFALLRIAHEQNASVKSGTQEITIELLPEGVSSIEFGVYS